MIRCKFHVSEVTRLMQPDGSVHSERVRMQAVTSPENAEWSRWTPSGSLDVTITNPDAYGKLASGHEFYVDFTPATDAV